MKNNFKKYSISILILFVGISIGYYINSGKQVVKFDETESEIRENSNFEFINPLLQCEMGHDRLSKKSIYPFEEKINKIIEIEKKNKNISYSSVYFRDLDNGSWFGINENVDFRPASLLKVVIMIYFLKLENQNRGVLDEKLVYNGESLDLDQSIKPTHQIEINKKYSVWELIEYMIKYSDNSATAKLYTIVDQERFIKLFRLFGITTPTSGGAQEFISVKQYSTFFRILFNSSYVGDNLSEKALSLLNQTEFTSGLRGSVPADIKVSHKFGETTLDSGEKQLHDCGIVYYPKKPYLICIMTRGSDFSKMSTSILNISKASYNEVDKQMREHISI